MPRTSLRGKVKKGVIGPELGKKLARQAARKDRIIIYRSAKRPYAKNIFIPKKVYKRHPRIIKPTKIRQDKIRKEVVSK